MSDTIAKAGAKAGAKMDRLEASRETLLSALREAYEKGPRNKPFEGDWAWDKIFLTAGLHGERDIAADFPNPGKRDVIRLKQIAGALRKARDLLAEDSTAEAGSVLMDVWYQDNVEQLAIGEEIELEAGEAFLAKMQNSYDAALAVVEQLARAADESANHVRSRKKRGHPSGGSQLPDDIIISLAAIFRRSTGTVPKIESTRPNSLKTAFGDFVRAYMQATNRHLADGSIQEAMKRAQAWALNPENQNLAQSPFKT